MHSSEYYATIKAKFHEILEESRGIISVAAKKAGIHLDTVYRWRREDEEFKNRIDAVRDTVDDYCESKLLELIEEKHPATLIYVAKTRLKHRGYGSDVTITPTTIIQQEASPLNKDENEILEKYIQQKIEERVQQEREKELANQGGQLG